MYIRRRKYALKMLINSLVIIKFDQEKQMRNQISPQLRQQNPNKTQNIFFYQQNSFETQVILKEEFERQGKNYLQGKKDQIQDLSGKTIFQRRQTMESQSNIDDSPSKEDDILFDQYLLKGSKWSQIAKSLPGRSQNSIKNKFYGTLRKTLRRINQIGKNNFKRYSKPIKYEALIRVLDAKEGMQNLPEKLMKDSYTIREKIVNLCRNEESMINQQTVVDFIFIMHKFNLESRCYKLKKGCKKTQSHEKPHEQISLSEKLPQISSYELPNPSYPQSVDNSQIKDKLRLIQQCKTQENNIAIDEEEFLFIEGITSPNYCSTPSDFEKEACQILGLSFSPPTDLFKEFF